MAKIYIIDDDRDIVESVSIVLKANGYEVASQFSDEDAVSNILKFGPDLVILDVMFPENNSAGFEIAREIKKNEKLAGIPIMMLSVINERGIYIGQFNKQDIDSTWLPVSIFLDKPIQPKELLKQIELILKK
jgi:DNA-binding response OmpR family regulator